MIKHSLNALLIGRDHSLAWALPQLLTRAGFCVDSINSSPIMEKCKFLRSCHVISPHQLFRSTILNKMKEQNYDWIIVTDDGTLKEIVESDLSLTDKLKLLPVQKEENFIHLHSKIGLSKVFASKGINTPLFSIAHNVTEALAEADQVGYPLLVKIDSSAGGAGVFEVNNPSELQSLNSKIFDQPVLIQQMISGAEWDLSALYFKGNLIHFNCAKIEKRCSKFGISSVRTYYPLSRVDEQIFHELAHIGKALGIHGFTNISCIQSQARRFYFEVDVRPNVWVEFPRFFREDPAIRIREWFSHKKTLSYPVPSLPNQPQKILLPYFLRLKRSELLFNRYGVWKYIPKDDLQLIFTLVRVFMFSGIKGRIISIIKWIVPKKYHTHLRTIKYILLNKNKSPVLK